MKTAGFRIVGGIAAAVALGVFAAVGVTGDGPEPGAEHLLSAPEKAEDPDLVRRAAEEALAKDAKDARAMRALLVAVTRMGERTLLDDAIARAKEWGERWDTVLRGAFGAAALRRARLEDPPDRAMLDLAAEALSFSTSSGPVRPALDLGYALHLQGDVPGAKAAYLRAITEAGTSPEDEEVADLAAAGLRSVLGGSAEAAEAALSTAEWKPGRSGTARTLATLAAERRGPNEALKVLESTHGAVLLSPRTLVVRARLLREVGRHAEALPDECVAVSRAGTVEQGGGYVLDAIERAWREKRPLASFDDCRRYERDYDDLLRRAEGFPKTQIAWLNNVALRFREVVSTFTWRGEGRTQGIAEGAPKEAHDLLARCVALYDGAVSLVPGDASNRPFDERWFYAGILNDAGLMRHYFVDVRDLDRAEALYRRAFDLTDGAYMDTYFYNLQYLYGFEKPGNEEEWFRRARIARDRILEETPSGLEPDERKRESAARDAAALEALLDSRR